MSSAEMIRPRRLLLTGVPGWLTSALLDNLVEHPLNGLQYVRALIHPASAPQAAELCSRYAALEDVRVYDMASDRLPDSHFDGADAVVHTAGIIHVKRTREWYVVNTEGTLRLAESARRLGVRRFVFISSNAAGGRSSSPERLLVESDPPEPLSHYGKSKLLAEQGLMGLHEPGRFEVVVLRPSMFYGPPVPERHLEIYRRILCGRMPLVGHGEFARSITYIDNLVQATRLALTHPRSAGQTYYIVDDKVYTTRQIAESMARALGTSARFIPVPTLAGPVAYALDCAFAAIGFYVQPLHLVGESHWHVGISCRKAMEELGYHPAVELDEGMRRAVEWCRRTGKLG